MSSTLARLVLVMGLLVAWGSGCSSNNGGSGVKPTCAKSATGCRCKNAAFDLNSDEAPTDSCNTLESGTWQCAFDLDSSGQSTKCDCQQYTCGLTSSACSCGFVQTQGTATTSCSVSDVPGQYTQCCEFADQSCSCFAAVSCPKVVTSCSLTSYADTPAPEHTATSCASVVWKAPSSGGGGGGGSKPECSSDSACSSACSGDCYQCSSGTCSCGYQGSDGCVF